MAANPSMSPIAAMFGVTTEAPQRPHVAAQAIELRRALDSYQTRPQAFTTGDLVVEKPGLGRFKKARSEQIVMIVWRKIDRKDPIEAATIAEWAARDHFAGQCDLIVAYMGDSNGDVLLVPHDSRLLEVWRPDLAWRLEADEPVYPAADPSVLAEADSSPRAASAGRANALGHHLPEAAR